MKTIVITGATSGIGLESARLLAQKHFRVLGVGHSPENCKKAEASLLDGNPDAEVAFFAADLLQRREVIRVAKELTEYLDAHCEGELYALINNAGCVRSWYMTTEEGYEQQFALNYLAGFLLTHELLPLLQKAGGRIIMTGSESHKGIKVRWNDVMLRNGYQPLTAYKQSKLCDILFARGINDRYAGTGIRAYTVDPGLVNTEIGSKRTAGIVRFFWERHKQHGVPPTVPAETYAFLCEQENAPSGLYYTLCRENRYSRQVTGQNADRLFALSERLCNVQFGKENEQ